MVKLFLPNSASPGQESQKCLKNKCTALVTSRKTRTFVTSRSDFVTSRQSKNFSVGHLAHGEKKIAACARWPIPWHYFWDIFGSPGQEGPSWAKWVSPLNSSMKTTTFKPNLYFCHRIPLSAGRLSERVKLGKLCNGPLSRPPSFIGDYYSMDGAVCL